MKIQDECYACLVRLVDLTVALATSASQVREQAKQAALGILQEEFMPGGIPAVIASRFHRVIREITGNDDPFAGRKAKEMEMLAQLCGEVARLYDEELESLLKLAVLGNAVDFFRPESEVRQAMGRGVEWEISAAPCLERLLQGPPGLLLYLADNAGEQFFDRRLVGWLRRQHWRVIYVVKGGPIQNDLTKKDLEASGLLAAMEPVVDTGARTVGFVAAEASASFLRLYQQADLILAKGMGHFETMSHLHDARIFFLLQAKCRPVAQSLGVRVGSYVLAQGA